MVPSRFDDLRQELDRFLARLRRDGTLARLTDRYCRTRARSSASTPSVLQERMRTVLPQYRHLFHDAQEKSGIEWRLLAAIAYQESQWDPAATSATGVRGIMQITEDTARHLGVSDLLDPAQNVVAAARYLRDLKAKLPARIHEPDRTWLALAAFNIGLGHLEDARILAQKQKLDPDLWSDVKKVLPLLALPEYYEQAKLGYARGGMPVAFVDRVRGVLRRAARACAGAPAASRCIRRHRRAGGAGFRETESNNNRKWSHHGLVSVPGGVDRAPDPDRARDRPRRRQHHLHLDPRRSPAAGAARAGAHDRPRARDGDAHRAAAVARVDDAPDRAAVLGLRARTSPGAT